MTFDELMAGNPARLVVQFQYGRDGSEHFQWGVVGKIPVLSLIGGIGAVEADLLGGVWMPECPADPASLVLVWKEEERAFAYYRHPDIPVYPLVGMLETIKAMLLNGRLAQHAASQSRVLGPDGQPMRF